jgi:hypothetical protein
MATRRTKRQIRAEEETQKHAVEEVGVEVTSVEEPQEASAPKRTELVTHVVEYGLKKEGVPLLDGLEATEQEMIKGDTLYLTVPKADSHVDLVEWLFRTFSYVGPLNVGTNPKLTNNDARVREGFLCVK